MTEVVELELAGTTYKVPALTFANVERVEDHIIALRGTATTFVERVKHAVPVIHAALSQVNKDITEQDVKEMLTLENYGRVLWAVLGVSGLAKTANPDAKAEVLAMGETKPVLVGKEQTGQSSTV